MRNENQEVKPFSFPPSSHLFQPELAMLLEWYGGSSLVEEVEARHQVQQMLSLAESCNSDEKSLLVVLSQLSFPQGWEVQGAQEDSPSQHHHHLTLSKEQ